MKVFEEYIIPINETAKDYDEMFVGIIRRQPVLIRCKDCKYSKCIEPNDDWLECQHDKRVNHSDGYCNWAERKEHETD